jgi:hypothetical protein
MSGVQKAKPFGRPLDGNTKGLPTFKQRRQCAKIGGSSHQSVAMSKGEVHERDYTRLQRA